MCKRALTQSVGMSVVPHDLENSLCQTAQLPAHSLAEGHPEVEGQGHFLDMDKIFFYRGMYFCCGQYIGSSSMFHIDISCVDKFQQKNYIFISEFWDVTACLLHRLWVCSCCDISMC